MILKSDPTCQYKKSIISGLSHTIIIMTSETTESYLLSSPMEESVGLSPPPVPSPVRAPPAPPPTPAPPRGRGRRNRKRKRQAPPDSPKTLTVNFI